MSTAVPSSRRSDRLTPARAAIVLLFSISWGTIVLLTWVIAIVAVGGGLAAVNLVVIGIVFWGPVVGSVAGGAHILASVVLGRWIQRLP